MQVKDLVEETNLYCSAEGISFQAMDVSHKCLVTWFLDGRHLPTNNSNNSEEKQKDEAVKAQYGPFQKYKCEGDMKVGINTSELYDYLQLINDDDEVTLRATEGSAVYELYFESSGTFFFLFSRMIA